LKRARIKQIDVFTSTPFAGSPTYVLTEADKLTEAEMNKIAKEVRSKTAFVQKASQNQAQFKLRFFTPKGEINLAAHSAIAAFHALAEEAKFFLAEPITKISQEINSGILALEIHCKSGQADRITINLPEPAFLETADSQTVSEILGINPDEMEKAQPQVVDVGAAHLIVPVKSLATVQNLKPDLYALSELNERLGAISTHVIALDAISPIAMAHTRNFAPALEISEIAGSGTASGALGAYLVSSELIRGNSPITFIAEQGHSVDRPCEILVEVYFRQTKVNQIKVSGQAVTVMEGEIVL